ncbi:MAG: S1/P1 nuclease [Pseudomonadales bacterium]|nr:S1/P1 nuclease [Pseudomonadales bacterium]
MKHSLCCLLLCIPLLAHGWGRQGHTFIGHVADLNLTPVARAAVQSLLVNDLDADGQLSGRHHLADIANWADEIRATPAGRQEASWHYRDVPVCEQSPGPCPEGHCIDEVLRHMVKVLRDNHASLQARNEALKWIVHLVGDMHQPLHVSDDDDHGGNWVKVRILDPHGRIFNLHQVWDTELVSLALREAPVDTQMPAHFISGSPDDWLRQSHQLGVKVAYGDLPGFACGQHVSEPILLNTDYLQRALPTIRQQLQLAGFRLAALLNQTLTSYTPLISINFDQDNHDRSRSFRQHPMPGTETRVVASDDSGDAS